VSFADLVFHFPHIPGQGSHSAFFPGFLPSVADLRRPFSISTSINVAKKSGRWEKRWRTTNRKRELPLFATLLSTSHRAPLSRIVTRKVESHSPKCPELILYIKAPKDTYKQSHRMVNLCSFWETHLIEKFKIEIKRFLKVAKFNDCNLLHLCCPIFVLFF